MFSNEQIMKFLGFIKEHNPEFKCSRSFSEFKTEVHPPSFDTYISPYFQNGVKLLSFTQWINDFDGESIGPLIIYTDGMWIWPSYYGFYLKKHSIAVPEFCLTDIANNGFVVPHLNNIEFEYCLYMLSKAFSIGKNQNLEISTQLRQFIKLNGDNYNCF